MGSSNIPLISSSPYPPRDRPFIHLDGFNLCRCLNNASFFTDLEIQLPGGLSALSSRTARDLVEHIEWSAQRILSHPERQKLYQRDNQVTADYTADYPLRGICFSLAQGNLGDDTWNSFVKPPRPEEWAAKHAGRILRTIDAEIALPFLNYKPKYTHENSKPHYNLAYMLLVHENPDNVKALIDALSDPTVFIYIHIDVGSPSSFVEEISKYIAERENVAIMPTTFAISWCHVSLLYVEIRAFFDLLDMIDFDYVINLSGADYPLKSAATIYRSLERIPGSNWLWWDDSKREHIELRTENMFHCADVGAKRCSMSHTPMEPRAWEPLYYLFPHRYKSSQWMILHRSIIEHLRNSEAGKLLMMWAENMLCSDEMILATFFASSPFASKTFRDPKRLIRWNGGFHPYDWNKDDKALIETWQQHFFWIRKVDVIGDPQLKKILDDIRARDEMSGLLVTSFEGRVTPVE